MDKSDLNEALRSAFGYEKKARSAAFWQRQHAARAAEAAQYLRVLLQLFPSVPIELEARVKILAILADFVPPVTGRPKDPGLQLLRSRERSRPRRVGRPISLTLDRARELLTAVKAFKPGTFTDKAAIAKYVDAQNPSMSEHRKKKLVSQLQKTISKAKHLLVSKPR